MRKNPKIEETLSTLNNYDWISVNHLIAGKVIGEDFKYTKFSNSAKLPVNRHLCDFVNVENLRNDELDN